MPIIYENTAWNIILKLAERISTEFPTSKVYKSDLVKIPRYSDAGTFTIEILDDDVNQKPPSSKVEDEYFFNIWIYLKYRDDEIGQKYMTDLAEHLKTFLQQWNQVRVNDLWYDSDVGKIQYGVKEKVINKTSMFLKAIKLPWSCKIQKARQMS